MARRRRKFPLAPAIGAIFGVAAAILVAATPNELFESAVATTGFANVSSAGLGARAVAIVCAFAVAALLIGTPVALVLRAIEGNKRRETDDALDLAAYAEPALRARSPIFADRDLGAPLMSDAALGRSELVDVESDPNDVDVSELAEPLAIEEFELPATGETDREVPGETSIEALIRRLEAGIARRRAPEDPGPSAPASPAEPIEASWARLVDRRKVARNDDDDPRMALGLLRHFAST